MSHTTTPLYQYLDANEGTFDDLLKCIEQTAKKSKTPQDAVVRTLNLRYPGLSFSYHHYQETSDIWVQDDKGVRLYDSEGNFEYLDLSEQRIEAEATVKYMHVNATGARPGEMIIGVHNISRDALIRVAAGIISPSKRDLDLVRMFPDLWILLLNKLGALDFFHEMTHLQREEWLYTHQRDGDYDLAEIPHVFIEILEVGKSTFRTIEEETLTHLLSGNPDREDRAWPIMYVRDQFPHKPGSKARRHTLIFFPHFWKISSTFKQATSFTGPVYHMKEKKMTSGAKHASIIIFGGLAKKYTTAHEVETKQEIGIIFDTPPRNLAPICQMSPDNDDRRKRDPGIED